MLCSLCIGFMWKEKHFFMYFNILNHILYIHVFNEFDLNFFQILISGNIELFHMIVAFGLYWKSKLQIIELLFQNKILKILNLIMVVIKIKIINQN